MGTDPCVWWRAPPRKILHKDLVRFKKGGVFGIFMYVGVCNVCMLANIRTSIKHKFVGRTCDNIRRSFGHSLPVCFSTGSKFMASTSIRYVYFKDIIILSLNVSLQHNFVILFRNNRGHICTSTCNVLHVRCIQKNNNYYNKCMKTKWRLQRQMALLGVPIPLQA